MEEGWGVVGMVGMDWVETVAAGLGADMEAVKAGAAVCSGRGCEECISN